MTDLHISRRLLRSALATLVVLGIPASAASAATTVPFSFTGAEQTFTVPAGVTSVQVVAVGAPGGLGSQGSQGPTGGLGGRTTSTVAVTPGETLYVEVGGPGADASNLGTGGFNGGGNSPSGGDTIQSGGGGGASDVRTCSRTAASCPGGGTTLGSRLVIAGGGGGAGDSAGGGTLANGNGAAGADASGFNFTTGGGGGATQSAGGTGGVSTFDPGFNGSPGTLGVGGDGGSGLPQGAGGGGGLYGGGGGAAGAESPAAGGGGGSSFGPAATTFAPGNTRTPSVTITYTVSSADLALTKQAKPANLMVGDTVTYKLAVTNRGPTAANGVTLADQMPQGLEILSVSKPCTGTSKITCSLGTISVGTTITITVRARAKRTGRLTNHATVSSTTPDPNPANNSARASVEVAQVFCATALTFATNFDFDDLVHSVDVYVDGKHVKTLHGHNLRRVKVTGIKAKTTVRVKVVFNLSDSKRVTHHLAQTRTFHNCLAGRTGQHVTSIAPVEPSADLGAGGPRF